MSRSWRSALLFRRSTVGSTQTMGPLARVNSIKFIYLEQGFIRWSTSTMRMIRSPWFNLILCAVWDGHGDGPHWSLLYWVKDWLWQVAHQSPPVGGEIQVCPTGTVYIRMQMVWAPGDDEIMMITQPNGGEPLPWRSNTNGGEGVSWYNFPY